MSTTSWGVIDGQRIVFPLHVRSFNAVTMTFAVPVDAAADLLPGSAFELDAAGDSAQLIVNACDYRDNPWGDYDEVNLGLLVRPVGGGDDSVGSFVYRMPVDQAFTCRAGNEVMGFPKTVEQIDVAYTGADVCFRLVTEGVEAFSLAVPRVRSDEPPTRIETVSYSYLHGVPHATPLTIDLARAIVDPADVRLELGNGPVADELRSLGLPRPPDLCTWGEGLSATFQLGCPI
jgi:hypothetical protein